MEALKEKQSQNTAPASVPESDNIVRFALDHDGNLLFASPEFYTILDCDIEAMQAEHISSFVNFSEEADMFEQRPVFGRVKADYFDTIREGSFSVELGSVKNVQKKTLHFSKIEHEGGKRFIIAAEIGEGAAEDEMLQDESFVAYLSGLQTHAADFAKSNFSSQDSDLLQMIEMSHDAMAVLQLDGTFARMNAVFQEISNLDQDRSDSFTFIDLLHPDDRSHIRTSLQDMMHDDSRQELMIDFEARMIGHGGSLSNDASWLEWRLKRSGDFIYCAGRNITDTKQHADILSRKEKMLEEAQAIGHMGHWRWEVGGEHIEWSDEIFRIFGAKRDDFQPTLDSVNRLLHRSDIGRMVQAFQRAIIEKNNYDMDFRVRMENSGDRYVRCEGKCELDEDGDVVALFGIMQDITPSMLQERELREAKEAAERAYAAKSQFLANISHELRTPLNAIIGFSEMMQRQLLGPIGTEKYLDYITGIRESGEHLLDLISDILDMSKIEAGKYELDLEEFNVAKTMRLAIHMIEGRALDAEVKLHINIPNEELQIVADRRGLMQIFLNLLSNAVKFTEPGGNVTVEFIERDHYLSVKVRDTGIGIPANKMQYITHPFEQAASHYTREHEGTGLGLSITKDLIDMHCGSMHIESDVGVGTVVTVRLPYNTHDEMKKK